MPFGFGNPKSGHEREPLLTEPDAAATPARRAEVPDLVAELDTAAADRFGEMLAMGHLVEAGLALTDTPPPLGTVKMPKRRPGRPAGRNYDKVTVSLDPELVSRLKEFSDLKGTSRSEAARDLLRAGLEAIKPSQDT